MNKSGIEWCDHTWNPITGYVEVVDRPLSRTKDITLLLEYDRVCREILERCG